ncbi:MAG: hypothetical protein COA79_21320 [Planctomycetota bacterium]|nr:MAG: hypothetical protein COA79_21320 [Planctomycetota bacterium]
MFLRKFILLSALMLISIGIFADEVTISVDTTISSGDATYDNKDVIIDGAVVTIDGAHTFTSLHLKNNATLTHLACTTSVVYKIDLVLITHLTIDAGSKIDVNTKGYLTGYTNGNLVNSLTNTSAGGSYGGTGGEGDVASGTNPVYGNLKNPDQHGAGGTSSSGNASGGGLIRIVSGQMIINGNIYADGEYGSTGGVSPAAAGGGIYLSTGTISGGGIVTANGGYTLKITRGAGGGGRIAIIYSSNTTFDFSNVSANAGNNGAKAENSGAVGTIYIKNSSTGLESLYLKNNLTTSRNFQLDQFNSTELELFNIFIDSCNVISNSYKKMNNLTITNASLLSHDGISVGNLYKLDLEITDQLTVDGSSNIDVSQKGYPAMYAKDFTLTHPATNNAGASHGGYGAKGYSADQVTNDVYGDFLVPTEYGAGANKSIGGGVIKIIADKFVLDGSLSAHGKFLLADGGGSAGGSIYLSVNELSGIGTMAANGGYGKNVSTSSFGGSGGGGRIAVYYENNIDFNLDWILANGGFHSYDSNGGNGTIYLKRTSDNDATLILKNLDRDFTAITPIYFGDKDNFADDPAEIKMRIICTDYGHAEFINDSVVHDVPSFNLTDNSYLKIKNISCQEFIMDNSLLYTADIKGAGIAVNNASTIFPYEKLVPLKIFAQTITVDSTSFINVVGYGYGAGLTLGATPSTGNSGGSHGGLGGVKNGIANPVYGSEQVPVDFGSGSANYSYGGGVLMLQADTLTINGNIYANGTYFSYTSGSNTNKAGPSGGSIYISAQVFNGTGFIYANGIHGYDNVTSLHAGSGGGGRVAVYHQNNNTFNFANIYASGGPHSNSSLAGADGTVYYEIGNGPLFTPVTFDDLPDLVSSNVVVTSTNIKGGDTINMTFTTTNSGAGNVVSPRNESVYLSLDNIFDPSDVLIGNSLITDLPLTTVAINYSINALVPESIAGDYYVLIVADGLGQVFEENETNNAGATSATINIADTQFPDTLLLSSPADGSIVPIGQYEISWAGTDNVNVGMTYAVCPPATVVCDVLSQTFEATSNGTYSLLTDGVYTFHVVTKDSAGNIDPTPISLSFTVDNTNPTIISTTMAATVSQAVSSIKIDFSESIQTPAIADFELYDDNNQLVTISSVSKLSVSEVLVQFASQNSNGSYRFVVKNTVVDLVGLSLTANHEVLFEIIIPDFSISNVATSGDLIPGTDIVISYSLNNDLVVDYNLVANSKIYLSADVIVDGGDVLLKTQNLNININGSNSVNLSSSISVPSISSGAYNILVVFDEANSIIESNEGNNLSSVAVNVNSFNLKLEALQANSTLNVSEVFNLSWRVKNDSNDQITLRWTDKIYLSTDNVIDGADIVLNAYTYGSDLDSNSSYTQNYNFTMPGYVSAGAKFIILKVDDASVVTESNEVDNIIALPITVTRNFNIAMTLKGEGSITVNFNSQTDPKTLPFNSAYAENSVVTIQSVPAAGWEFQTWTGSTTSTSDPLVITVSGDTSHYAEFLPLFSNPNILEKKVLDGSIQLTWQDLTNQSFVDKYELFIETATFTSLSGLTPVSTLGKDIRTHTFNTLTNGTTYYIAVVAKNKIDHFDDVLNIIQGTPLVDDQGPDLFQLKINGQNLNKTSSNALYEKANITAVLSDPSGVASVTYEILNDQSAVIETLASTEPLNDFLKNWDTVSLADGSYKIRVKAKDSKNNETIVDFDINLVFTASPSAPNLNDANQDLYVKDLSQLISGSSESSTEVVLLLNQVQQGSYVAINGDGSFGINATLTSDGLYLVTAKAKYVGREFYSELSQSVRVHLETTEPTLSILTPITPTTATVQAANYSMTGTMEDGASIYVNNVLIVTGVTGVTTWSHDIVLVENVAQNFTVKAVDKFGNEKSEAIAITYVNSAPTDVAATITSTPNGEAIVFNWLNFFNDVNHQDINQFKIYISSATFSDFTGITPIIVNGDLPGYTVTGLTKNQTYYYAIVAIDDSVQEGSWSTLTVNLVDTQPPAEVQALNVTGGDTELNLTWTANTDSDFNQYQVLQGAVVLGTTTNTTYQITGLTAETSYDITVKALDQDANASAGTSKTICTWLQNPTGLAAVGKEAAISLSWQSNSSPHLINYAIYAEETDFTSIDGLFAKVSPASSDTSVTLSGLDNDKTYYIAVVSVGVGNSIRSTVTAISGQPVPDNVGPVLVDFKKTGDVAVEASTIVSSTTITYVFSDESGIKEIIVDLDGQELEHIYSTKLTGSFDFLTNQLTNGAHSFTITTIDSKNNSSNHTVNFQTTLALPTVIPAISAPINGEQTNLLTSQVIGSAVLPYNEASNGVIIVENLNDNATTEFPFAFNSKGEFSVAVNYYENVNNKITVLIENSAGRGPSSSPVIIAVDTTLPSAPQGVVASAKENGVLQVSWQKFNNSLQGYDIYRSATGVTTDAVLLNVDKLQLSRYEDLPATDGEFTYFVKVIDKAGNVSEFSSGVKAVSDRVSPDVVSLTLTNFSGNKIGEIFGAGTATVNVVFSEALLTKPFLALTAENRSPITLDLVKTTDNNWQSQIDLSLLSHEGTAIWSYSGRDKVGNRSNVIPVAFKTLEVDSKAPIVTTITSEFGAPFQNDNSTPLSISFTLATDEPVDASQLPTVSANFIDSTTSNVSAVVVFSEATSSSFTATFTFPADVGQNGLTSFTLDWQGQDGMGNVGSSFNLSNSFKVYQGELPAAGKPVGLSAVSLASGKIKLNWLSVADADGFKLIRQDLSNSQDTIIDNITENEYEDLPPADGNYEYRVASVRAHNGQSTASEYSEAATSVSDRLKPNAPTSLQLSTLAQYIKIEFSHDQLDFSHFNIYRSATGAVLNTVYMEGPTQSPVYDPNISAIENFYAVTAVDAAGNESDPTTFVYENPGLQAISSIDVLMVEGSFPQVSWQHPNPTAIDGYNISAKINSTNYLLSSGILTAISFEDKGFTKGDREYVVEAVDSGSTSLERSFLVPDIKTEITSDKITKGIFSSVMVKVDNLSSSHLIGLQVNLIIDSNTYSSDIFTLNGTESKDVSIVVGVNSSEDITSIIELETIYQPLETEKVTYKKTRELPAKNASLELSLQADNIIKGQNAQVRLVLTNNSDEQIEVVTARINGTKASNDVRFELYDLEDNFLSYVDLKDALGENIITLPNGEAVVRLQPGQVYKSEPINLLIPEVNDSQVKLTANIDKIYFDRDKPTEKELLGLSSSLTVSLQDTPYYAVIDSVSPEVAEMGEPITISGTAFNRSDDLFRAGSLVKVAVITNGFVRKFDAVSDSAGLFSVNFVPLAKESGVFEAKAFHPDQISLPLIGKEFVIRGYEITPDEFLSYIPKNTSKDLPISVKAKNGTYLSNVTFEYDINDQPGGSFLTGVNVILPTVFDVASGNTSAVTISISGDQTAPDSGEVYVRISEGTPKKLIKKIKVAIEFSEANPSLISKPSFVESGGLLGDITTEKVTLKNDGLIELENIELSLSPLDEATVPNWIHLITLKQIGNLDIGDSKDIEFMIAPSNTGSVVAGWYSANLVVSADNADDKLVPLYFYAAAQPSGPENAIKGGALFKLSDIYTFTFKKDAEGNIINDGNGNPIIIEGVDNAKVEIQSDTDSSIYFSGNTDDLGEITFNDLLPGFYKYNITADSHQQEKGTFWVKTNVVSIQEVFLKYNLVTVEWDVIEKEIVDVYTGNLDFVYDVKITQNFLSDAPAAVVLSNPAQLDLPLMKKGDVHYGEFQLINYGLIRAFDVTFILPEDTEYIKFELIDNLPDAIEAKEIVTIPYKAICLKDKDNITGNGSGEECKRYFDIPLFLITKYVCQNKTVVTDLGKISIRWPFAGCGDEVTPDEPEVPETVLRIIRDTNYIINYVDSGGGGGGNSRTEDNWLEFDFDLGDEFKCSPRPGFGCDGCPCEDDKESATTNTGSAVDLVHGHYSDYIPDFSYQVMGGQIGLSRVFENGRWKMEFNAPKMEIVANDGPQGYILNPPFSNGEIADDEVGIKDICSMEGINSLVIGSLVLNKWEFNEQVISTYTDSTGKRHTDVAEYKFCYGFISSFGGTKVDIPDPEDPAFNTNNVLVENKDGTYYKYSLSGYVTEYGNLTGVVEKYAYDNNSNIISVSDRNDQVVISVDRSVANTEIITGRDGKKKHYIYDGEGYLLSVKEFYTDEEFLETKYSYEEVEKTSDLFRDALLIRQSDVVEAKNMDPFDFAVKVEEGEYTTAQLKFKRLIKKELPNGKIYNISYTSNSGRVKSVTDENSIGYNFSYAYIPEDELHHVIEKHTDGNIREVFVGDDGFIKRVIRNGNLVEKYNRSKELLISIDENGSTKTTKYNDSLQPIEIEYPDKTKEKYAYNEDTRIVEFENRNKVKTIFEYNSDKLLYKIISAQGLPEESEIIYEYNNDKLLNKITKKGDVVEGDQVLIIEYDDHGRFWKFTDALGYFVEFMEFGIDDEPTKIKDKEGHIITFEQDSIGRITKEIDGLNNITNYSYQNSFDVTKVERFGLNFGEMTFNTNRQITKEIEPDGGEYSITYSATTSYLSQITDPLGNKTDYKYDLEGRMIEQTDALGNIIKLEYDDDPATLAPSDTPVKIITPSGSLNFEFDNMGRITKEVLRDVNNLIYDTTTYVYTDADNISKIIYNDGSEDNYIYDANSMVKESFDRLGNSYKFEYSKRGNLTAIVSPDSTRTEFTNDKNDQVTKVIQDPAGLNYITDYEYSPNGNMTKITTPNGGIATATYDAEDRILLFTDPDGVVVENIYDDPNFKIIQKIVDIQNVTHYDASGRTIKEVDSFGRVSEFEYDLNSNLKSLKFPGGYRLDRKFDKINSLVEEIDSLGNSTKALFDDEGRSVGFVDPNSRKTTSKFDDKGEVESVKYDDDLELKYTYNNMGSLQSLVDKNGSIFTYTYNLEEELIRVNVAPGVGLPVRSTVLEFDYDVLGRLTEIKDNGLVSDANDDSVVRIEYDSLNQIKSEVQIVDGTVKEVQYTYVGKGIFGNVIYPSGRQATNEYSLAGRMKKISFDGTQYLEYLHNTKGQVTDKVFGNTLVSKYEYDFNRRKNIKLFSATSDLLDGFNYQYGQNDEFKIIEDLKFSNQNQSFSYDSNLQLISYQNGVLNGDKNSIASIVDSQSFNLDAVGNWLDKTSNNNKTTYQYNAMYGMTSANGVAYKYDKNGNLLEDNKFKYQFDAFNRLISVISKDGNTIVEYAYDGLNRRIKKSVNQNIKTRFTYSGDQVIEESVTSATGTETIVEYVYADYIDEVIARFTNGALDHYYHHNHQYSVTSVSNSTGSIVEYYRYDPYGKQVCLDGNGQVKSAAIENLTYGYTSRRIELETDLYYFRARYYSVEMGRFISVDPAGYVDGLSLYLNYFDTNGVDPSGEFVPFILAALVRYLVVVVINTAVDVAYDYATNPCFNLKNSLFENGLINVVTGGQGGKLKRAAKPFFNKAKKKLKKYYNKAKRKAKKIKNRVKNKFSRSARNKGMSEARKASTVKDKLKALTKNGYSMKEAKRMIKDGVVCFVAGTQVVVKNGDDEVELKKIENIKVGDKVLAKSVRNSKQDFKNVTHLITTHPSELFTISYKDIDGELYNIVSTGEHPFWVADKGWVTVRNLSIADRFETASGESAEIVTKTSEFADEGKTFTTYNFTVEDYHTYYVLPEGETDGNSSVWVHNAGRKGKKEECTKVKKKKKKETGKHSKKLRKNLNKAGRGPIKNEDAAHIVASGHKRHKEARKLLKEAGINKNSAVNGVGLPSNYKVKNPFGKTRHPSTHNSTFMDMVTKRLRNVSPEKRKGVLDRIRRDLEKGKY